MYLLYCALTSFFLALLYESTSLRGLHLPNGLLAFLLFGGISLLISSSKRYRIPLFLLSLLIFILSLFNLLKVHFHLADIGFFDVALLKAGGEVAAVFLDQLPYFSLAKITLLFLIWIPIFWQLPAIIGLASKITRKSRHNPMQSFSQKTDRLFAKPWLKIVPLTMLVFFFVFSTQVTTVLSGSAFSNLLLSGKVMARLKIQEWQRSHTPLPTPAPGPTQPTETGDAPPVTEVAPVLTEKQQKILAISQLEEAQVDSADPLLNGYPFQKPKEMDLIVIQSETFFDLPKYQDRLEKNGIVIHDDAISTHFHYYQDNGISGIIHVPTVGGGTVNTEYEALTGYGAKYFSRGTIIFTSILKHKTNAFPHFFKEVMENPVTIAIHNHNKEYWDRDRVYPLLGFDEYIDMTMFTKEEQEDLVGAWMSDKTIFDMTIRQLEAHPGKNIFLLPVTVQNHGPFLGWKSSIQIDNLSRDDGWQITHYASNLKYSDEQLKIFMDYIDAREKPTIVVFYGDHKPDPNYDMFKNSEYYNQNNRQNLFNTDYFIYFNAAINDPKLLALKGVHQDLTAPALNRYLQMLLGDSSPFSLFLYNHTKKPENYFDAECIAGAKDSAFRDISMDFINEWIPYSDFEMK